MDKEKRRSTPSASSTSKKRRKSSSPPALRRVTRLSVSNDMSDGTSACTNGGQKQNGSSCVTLTPKSNKRKRRSSMRRTSLVATLVCIQPLESKGAELNSNVTTSANDVKKELQSDSKVVTLQSTIDDADCPSSTTEVSSTTKKSLSDIGVPDASNVINDGSVIAEKLRAEGSSWEKQLEKYNRLQSEKSIRKKHSSSVDFQEMDPKYLLWHEKISDLEDRFSNEFSAVSNAMGYIHQLILVHLAKVSKLTEDSYNRTVQVRDGEEVKILIKQIFDLHNSAIDS